MASLRQLLGQPPARPEIRFRREPATRVLAIGGEQPLDGAFEWFRSAFDELHALVPPSRRTGPDGALYYPDFFHADAGRVTVFVATDCAPQRPGRAAPLHLPAIALAVTRHDGPLGDLDRTYGVLGAFVAGRAIGADGPIRERFLDSSASGRHLVEVGWPVAGTDDDPTPSDLTETP